MAHTIAHDLESSYKTRKIKKSASWEPMFCVILNCLIVICFRMHALFLLLVDHVSN
jgi:hypothetical protein